MTRNPATVREGSLLRRCCGGALLIAGLLGAVPAMADAWAHRIAVRTDVAYGDDPAQRYDLYVQGERLGEPDYFRPMHRTAEGDDRPVLMWIHGGGWLQGDKASEAPNLIPYLEAGYHVASVNYRQGPDTAPRAVDDVMCAYRELVQTLQQQGSEASRVVVSGASAGGHLALMVGLLNTTGEHECRAAVPPRAVVNWFGITDLEAVDRFLQASRPEQNYARLWAGGLEGVQKLAPETSPVRLVTASAPPVFTVHGTVDTVVPFSEARALHDKLTTPNALLPMAGGNHSGFSDRQYRRAYKEIFRFLRRYNR